MRRLHLEDIKDPKTMKSYWGFDEDHGMCIFIDNARHFDMLMHHLEKLGWEWYDGGFPTTNGYLCDFPYIYLGSEITWSDAESFDDNFELCEIEYEQLNYCQWCSAPLKCDKCGK